jgi:hypothetical protein
MNTDIPRIPSPTQRSTHGQTLMLAIGAFILVFVLWQTSSSVLYPFRLFVTFVHEAGHGLTAILTGGQFLRFEVFANGSGVATSAGGSRFLIPQMGYLGAALFGAILLYSTNRVRHVNVVAAIVGLIFAGCAILFTGTARVTLLIGVVTAIGLWLLADRLSQRTNILRAISGGVVVVTVLIVRSEVALIVGIVGGALLVALGVLAPRQVTIFVLNFLAFITGFNAVSDIWSLMNNRGARLGNLPNDALTMANSTFIPVEFWIIVWTVLAILMMGAAIYFALIRRRKAT